MSKRGALAAWLQLENKPKRPKHARRLKFCMACVVGNGYHHGHFEGCPDSRKKTAFTARELAGQRNAARRFLEGKKNSGTVAEIEQYQWYQDLVALASVATSNRGLGPACKLCKRKTTLKVANNRGPHFGRKYYKCLPCAKWNSWAEPEPTLEDSAWERADEAALAEAEALEALDAARDDATVDLTEPADVVDLTQD